MKSGRWIHYTINNTTGSTITLKNGHLIYGEFYIWYSQYSNIYWTDITIKNNCSYDLYSYGLFGTKGYFDIYDSKDQQIAHI